jgi:type IV pilus assembly protein PilW
MYKSKVLSPVPSSSKLSNKNYSQSNKGFTLVELLISITLGLLIVLAATQLFFGGVLSVRLQQAGADVQDGGVFGLDFLSQHIRLSNFGNDVNRLLTDSTPFGGIVVSADATAIKSTTGSTVSSNLPMVRDTLTATSLNPALVSSSNGDTVGAGNAWQGLSNVTTASGGALLSDQLTIQFQAPSLMTNCEGATVAAGSQVLERYFLRADTITAGATGSKIQNLVLACNAATITVSSPTAAQALTAGAGQTLMNRVDYLHFLLGTQIQDGSADNGKTVYYTINQYKTIAKAANAAGTLPPRIVMIKVAMLVRSLDNTGNGIVDPTKTYTLLDQTVKPVAETNQTTNRYVRQVYQTTIALRNSLGAAS